MTTKQEIKPAVNLTALAETRKLADRASLTPGGSLLLRPTDANAASVAATDAAADVLIEVARTLLVYNAAKREAARCREAWSKSWTDDAMQDQFDVADVACRSARREHDAAIAKVSL